MTEKLQLRENGEKKQILVKLDSQQNRVEIGSEQEKNNTKLVQFEIT